MSSAPDSPDNQRPHDVIIRTRLAAAAASMRTLLPEGKRIVLAVSGGSDSIGMMHLAAAALGAGIGERAVVGFVDHRLRGVEAEWELVSKAAASLGLPATRLLIPEEEAREARERGSLQAWARDARYELLFALAARVGADRVATGHTRDDQAETFLIRLLRGAGLDGLGSIAPYRDSRDGIAVVRPMLDVGREEIRGALKELEIPWAEDPSNVDPRHLRVRVRNELLPLMEELQPRVAERIAAVSSELRGTSAYLSSAIEDGGVLTELRLCGGVRIDAAAFTSFPRTLWGRLVRHALRAVRGDLERLDRAHYALIMQLIADGRSTSRIPLPGGASVYLHRGALFAFPGELPPRPTGAGQPVASGARLWRVRFAALGAAAEIERRDDSPLPCSITDLELRARRPGDRISGSATKLKEVLSDGGVPRPYRDFIPLLASGDEIVSCPGLVSSRLDGVVVRWVLDDAAPFLDVDFPRAPRRH
jgi:tRNA(Ile)-lysidine synthase